jgi:hypothetical protein
LSLFQGGSTVKRKSLYLVVCFVLFFGCAALKASAAPRVIITPQSDGVYVIQGIDFSGVSGVDLTIHYDPAALAGPRVSQGSLVGGALMAANLSTPGTARLALVRAVAINGSGPIATVTFNRVGSTGADIQALTASVLSGSGRTIQAGTDIVNFQKTADNGQGNIGTPPADSSSPGSPVDVSASGSARASTDTIGVTAASSSSAAPGILLVPASSLPEKVEARTTAAPSPEQAAPETRQSDAEKTIQQEAQVALAEQPAVKAPEPEKKKVMAYPGVLEKFREYKGKKSPRSLTALFGENPGQQDPPLVLSDGKTTVRMIIKLDSKGENNNILLDGASLVSLRNKEGNIWIAELLPDRRTWQASVSVPENHQLTVMPLNVAPPMDVAINHTSGGLTEADFKAFLKDRGTSKTPRFDLNGDGVRDYIDDYIFTANYLAQPKGKKAQDKGK